jgi:hypothetical protein
MRRTRLGARRPVGRRALALSALAAAVLPAMAACQGSPSASGPVASASGSASGTHTTTVSGATYVTGAKVTDDACARVVSAIGYLDPLLLPPGQEDRQKYSEAVRGRFGYLRGTLDMYAPHLPSSLAAPAATMSRVSGTLADSATDSSARPALLREYREAATTTVDSCGRTPATG